MTLRYTFTYLPCQSCTQRVNCEACQTEISQMLMRVHGIQQLDVYIARKAMTVEFADIDSGIIEDILEDAGVFID